MGTELLVQDSGSSWPCTTNGGAMTWLSDRVKGLYL